VPFHDELRGRKANQHWIALKPDQTFFTMAERSLFPAEWSEHYLEVDGAPFVVLKASERLQSSAISWFQTDSPELPQELCAIINELIFKYAHNL
jgi:hypothetical protein